MSGLTSQDAHLRFWLRAEIWVQEMNKGREEIYEGMFEPIFHYKIEKGLFRIPIEVSSEVKTRHE
jgi:hypothetical protein